MIAVPLWAAGTSGKLMHVTVQMTMNMQGMPTIGPRSVEHDVCMPAGKFDPAAMQHAMDRNKDVQCRVANLKWMGSNVSYDVTCSGKASMTMHADMQMAGEDSFTGKSHVTMDAGGHTMTMDNAYTAKRVGSCDYTPPPSS
ncbi:MAG TPA: DUF3617 family protein [Rhodanobacteraceae bacterium]|nr:DUF3617 family protein [Rhodanobacteraceae bacterium]